MVDAIDHQAFLNGATIAPEVSKLRPDYRVLLVIVGGIPPGPSDKTSENALKEAEDSARKELAGRPVTEIEHVAAWREAYKAFGAKPAKARNSLEALLRRVEGGLPRVNRLTDIYNAISVKHRIPLGGEDLNHYASPPRLIRATGKEGFEVISQGSPIMEQPDAGEVVWCDDGGVTCRRWNWRQCNRTALNDDTTTALFIFDALGPVADSEVVIAGEELISLVKQFAPDVRITRRLIHAS